MKILQINSTLNWGSTGKIAEEIGQGIQHNNGTSYIAYGRYRNPSTSIPIKIGTKLDFYIHAIQTRLFDNHGLASKCSTIKLIKKIKEINPDIIHLHNIHGYYLNYSILFNFLSNSSIPIVWTLHDCWAFTGHCSHFMYKKCERWKTECYKCPLKKSYPQSLLFDRSKKNFDYKKKSFTSVENMTLVPVSKWLSNEIKNSFLNKFPIQVIHNGIDIEVFHPIIDNYINKKYGIDDRFIILGLTNIWAERKGLNDIIQLNELIDHSVYQIVLVGLNPKQIKQIPKTIIGIPRTDSLEDLVKLYSQAGVFINPTWEDNFPTTNLEALACGTPVITYNTGGSPEAIDEKTGYVVPKGDINKLYEAIKNVQQGKINREECRQRAIRHYNKEDRFKEYIDLYNSLL